MSQHIPKSLSELVHERSNGLCEYCRLPQSSQEATFHIDHIQPLSTNGPTVLENLALACVTCSLRKAARTNARDAVTNELVPLFHPRRERWSDHFRWGAGGKIVGRTSIWRATAAALAMNRPAIVAIRRTLAKLGAFPPEPAD